MPEETKRYGIKVTTEANYSYIIQLHPEGVSYSTAFHVCADHNAVRPNAYGSDLKFEPVELSRFFN